MLYRTNGAYELCSASKSELESIKTLIRSNLNESSISSSATEYISELSDFAAVIGSFKNDKKIFQFN